MHISSHVRVLVFICKIATSFICMTGEEWTSSVPCVDHLLSGLHISAPDSPWPFVLLRVIACRWRSKDVLLSQSHQCGSISTASSPRQYCPERPPPPLGLPNRAVRARSSVRGLSKEMIQSWPTLRAIEGLVE